MVDNGHPLPREGDAAPRECSGSAGEIAHSAVDPVFDADRDRVEGDRWVLTGNEKAQVDGVEEDVAES